MGKKYAMKFKEVFKKLFNQNTFTGRAFSTILTTLATLAAIFSAGYPVFKSNLESEIQYRLIRYTKALDDYERTTDLFDRMQSGVYAAIFINPLIKKLEEKMGEAPVNMNFSPHYVEAGINSLKKEFNDRLIDVSTKPISIRNEGRYLGDVTYLMVRELYNEYSSVLLVCAVQEEEKVLVKDYLKDKYNQDNLIENFFGIPTENLPKDLKTIANISMDSLEVGKVCMEKASVYFEHQYFLREFISDYIKYYDQIEVDRKG